MPTSTPTELTILNEISTLQRLIHRTRRDIRRNKIDPIQGGRFITQASIALSKLILAQHRIAPDPMSELYQKREKLRTEIQRIFDALGWNDDPNDTTPSPPPSLYQSDQPKSLTFIPFPPDPHAPKQKPRKQK